MGRARTAKALRGRGGVAARGRGEKRRAAAAGRAPVLPSPQAATEGGGGPRVDPARRFAFSTNAFVRRPLSSALSAIRAAGFGGVEILADKPPAFCAETTDSGLLRLSRLVRASDLFVTNVNANTAAGYWRRCPPEAVFEPSLISRDAGMRRWRVRYTKRAIDLAAAVGSPAVSVTSGRCPAGLPPEKALSVLRRSLEEVLRHAERLGVRVGIEYEPGLLIERTEELVRLIEKVKHPRLGANLDIGHVVVAGEDPRKAIRALAGRIWNVHLEDIRGRKHYHLVPGEGDVDLPGVLRALERTGYRGGLTWELYTGADAPERAARATARYGRRFLADRPGRR